MEAVLRSWIVDLLAQRRSLLRIALRQRAKFEGWLKFELAVVAEQNGAIGVEVEAASGNGYRSDLSFVFEGERYQVELKTPNTNWRMPGVVTCTRPITKNIQDVLIDCDKLRHCDGTGIIAFCLFPIEASDGRWLDYLNRIGSKLGIGLTEVDHTSRVTVPLSDGHQADIIVATFPILKDKKDLLQP
jgi:hypothetical protein